MNRTFHVYVPEFSDDPENEPLLAATDPMYLPRDGVKHIQFTLDLPADVLKKALVAELVVAP